MDKWMLFIILSIDKKDPYYNISNKNIFPKFIKYIFINLGNI